MSTQTNTPTAATMPGLSYDKNRSRWRVRLTDFAGKRHYVGRFMTRTEAEVALAQAQRKYMRGCACLLPR
jgi:hypothetical protein